jgi:hypothetical protein
MATTPTVPSAEQLEAVRTLYEDGRMLSAYRAGCAAGPLATWTPPAGRILAGRLAHQIGAPRLGHCLFRSAFRAAPDDPQARCYHGRYLWTVWGGYHAWTWMARQPAPGATVDPEICASWFSLGSPPACATSTRRSSG